MMESFFESLMASVTPLSYVLIFATMVVIFFGVTILRDMDIKVDNSEKK